MAFTVVGEVGLVLGILDEGVRGLAGLDIFLDAASQIAAGSMTGVGRRGQGRVALFIYLVYTIIVNTP